MSQHIDYVCKTCREIHVVPRAQYRFGKGVVPEFEQKILGDHQGHDIEPYSDIAPTYMEGDDLMMDGMFSPDNKSYVYCKDYGKFKVVKYTDGGEREKPTT